MRKSVIILLLALILPFTIKAITRSDVTIKYDNIKIIQGNFSETLCSENEGTCQQFDGKFFISRPYFCRLEVTNPEKQLIVNDSTNLYIYLINKKKVYVQSTNAGINFFKIFDMFLNDTTSFIMTSKDSGYSVLAYKKDTLKQQNYFEELKLYINNKTHLIEQFSFTDLNNTEIEFQLADIKTNVKLSTKLFKFEIPKGVEVIKY